MMVDDKFVTLNGLKFHFLEWGDRQSCPTIIMLHGLRAYADTWVHVAERLADRYHILALTQRGRGKTDWDEKRNYYTDAYLADLKAFIDYHQLKKFYLLGHSMGGTVGYCYADAYPERVEKLIIEDIGPGSSVKGAGFKRIIKEMREVPLDFASLDEAAAYWRRLRPQISDEAVQQRIEKTMREGEDGKVHWLFDMAGIKETRVNPDPARVTDLGPVAARIKIPVLVVRGEKSDFLTREACEAMVAANANIQWAEIEGASHYVHDDNFDGFMAQIEKFLQS